MYINRTAHEALLRLASQFPVVGLTGPRQSGKSTLAKMTFPEKQYFTFDDKSLRDLAASNPKDFLLSFPNGAIIDEAQKVPEISDAVKFFVDNRDVAPGTFILTGSSQFRLKENMTDSLAGRVAFLKLLPLSIAELNTTEEIFETPYDMILKGFYPPLHDVRKHFVREDWFESYIDTYLDYDVKELINASNLSLFRRFIQICATLSGQMVSMDSISRNLGVSSPTVKNWLSILESSYIIHFLEPDTNNLGKAVVKTPKLYFVDTGLLCHLLRIETIADLNLNPNKGGIVETFAVSELLKTRLNRAKKANLTFFRDNKGFEVDIIADWKHTFAVEIKSSSDAERKLSASVRKYTELRSDVQCEGTVLYLGDLTCRINDINYVSWKDWGKFFENV